MDIRIGTSGWHYKHWVGLYYPEGMKPSEMLAWYTRDFDTVEVNNSFYHLPSKETFEAWRDAVPFMFQFSVKGSRFITHMKKLKDPEVHIPLFFSRVEALGTKLGPVLWQLPPHWHCNVDRLSAFLDALPKQNRHAFELRDTTWHTPAVFDLLRRHNAAFCLWHLSGVETPVQLTADFTYIRLHGPEGAYAGSYSAEALRTWADRITRWESSLRAAYVYFDNDQAAYAVQNALALKAMLPG